MKRKPARKPVPPRQSKPGVPAEAKRVVPPVAPRVPPVRGEDGYQRLSKQQVDAIRKLAIAMAGSDVGSDAVMICNPMSEPSALPLSELLYDRCRWCETAIYYDRLMPSPPGLMRVCVPCGILLLEAEKKGAN